MFPEEARIIFSLLAHTRNRRILNVCSSGEFFWKGQQRYIWDELLAPLQKNGNAVVNLDIDDVEGVDIVNDCANMIDVADGEFDVVLFNSAIEHILDVESSLAEIKRVLKPGGTLVASAPGVYPRHDAPVDTMLRLPGRDDWERLLGPDWHIDRFRKTTPMKAKPGYQFEELVYATIVLARISELSDRSGKPGPVSAGGVSIVSTEEYLSVLDEHQDILEELERIVRQSGAKLEGNCFYQNMSLVRRPELLDKQRNLFSVARAGDRIMEIGFNAGHSTLVFLLANPFAEITCFDLGSHAYTQPAFDYLDRVFPERLRMYRGHSNETVREYVDRNPTDRFDVLHIDGGHFLTEAHQDFINCRKLATENSIVIFDDVDIQRIGRLWDRYASDGFVRPFDMLPTPMYAHAFGLYSNLDNPLPADAGTFVGMSGQVRAGPTTSS